MPRFKQRFSLVMPAIDNNLGILDTLKVADTVLYLVSAVAGQAFGAETIDDWGMNVLQTSFGQVLSVKNDKIPDDTVFHLRAFQHQWLL